MFFVFVLTNTSFSQSLPDSLKKIAISDSTADSTAKVDSLANNSLADSLGIRISPDALPSVVTANASDSAVLNMSDNVFDLYGNAKINYEESEITAHKVSYQQSNNIITAALADDSAILAKGKPTFSQGKEKFTYDSLQYNFKSKRAIVRNAHSQYGEGFVHSNQIKRNPDQSVYGSNSLYTTCALETPHFGIAARKIKVIPGRVIASGPANLNIENVPTPLFLPFGLFPISQGQRSGFKIPTYTIEENRGLGLLNGGYYFSISEKADLLVDATFFSKGSWAANLFSNYANRYRYNGAITFRYAYNKLGETYEPGSTITKDYNVQWAHRSDPKSRPGVSFSASVDAGTTTYNANNTFTTNQILQNQYQSNITYSKQWQNRPFTLSVGARHSQNTQNRVVQVTLPEINFFVSQFNPFQNKKNVRTHWYDKITAQYTFSAINQTSFYDTSFSFDNLSTSDFQNGMLHSIPISASYNVLRFLNLTVRSTYKEYWLTKRMYKSYNRNTDKLDSITTNGFYTARDFDAGIDFNTRIYGTKLFKKGKIAGIRHVLTPGVGFGYLPDYAAAPFNYGYQTRQDPSGALSYASAYEGNVPGAPGYGQFGQARSAVNFGIDNNLQVKVRNLKDSTGFKNIRIIDNFKINSAYNLAADSFNWSNISMSFATMLFNILNLSANANYDPYAFDYATGRRLQQTHWDVNKGIARFQSANISLAGGFHGKSKEERKDKAAGNSDEYKRLMQYGRYSDYVDFSIPFNLNFSYVLGINKQYSTFSKSDTLVLSQHYLGIDGDINLTPRWKIGIRSGYDFNSKQLQITSIDIYRDMHCWEMRISTIPFGQRKSYFFTLQVKASILQDLKLVRRRDYRDAL